MNIADLKKVKDFIKNANFKIEIVDFNEQEAYSANLVQVNVESDSVVFCYQTSNTLDYNAQSSILSINNESEAIDALTELLIKNGFESEFIENNLDEISNLIKETLKVQELYDEYMTKFGDWESAANCIDANSEIFVVKADEERCVYYCLN
jgi:hypothetical protein